MNLKQVFKEGWDYLNELVTKKSNDVYIIGPFKASIHLQGENQRGVLIPKDYHNEEWFKELLNRKKHSITIIVEDVSKLD